MTQNRELKLMKREILKIRLNIVNRDIKIQMLEKNSLKSDQNRKMKTLKILSWIKRPLRN